jgi:hypothetical protein
MTSLHAILWLDHQDATLIHFDRLRVQVRHLKAGSSTPHGRAQQAVARELAWHAALIEALGDSPEILIVGPSTAKFDLMHTIESRYPAVKHRVLAVEPLDLPDETRMLARARDAFDRIDRMRRMAALA